MPVHAPSRQAAISIRTLPMRVAPPAGEALDSWLEAVAHRYQVSFGDVLSAHGVVVIVLGAVIAIKGGDFGGTSSLTLQPFTPGALFAGSLPIALLFCYASFVLLGVLVLIEVAISVTLAGLPYVADEILATKGAMAPPIVCVIGTNAGDDAGVAVSCRRNR